MAVYRRQATKSKIANDRQVAKRNITKRKVQDRRKREEDRNINFYSSFSISDYVTSYIKS
jgi:hypothetical protein